MLNIFATKPIKMAFQKPTAALIKELHEYNYCQEILPDAKFIIGNDYYQQKLPGSLSKVFCRTAVFKRMQALSKLLMPGIGIYFFDVFRTKATQAYIFNECRTRLQQQHPEYSLEKLEAETRKYVSHPDEPTRFTAPPHNTGGAIDLALIDLKTKKMLNYGSPIDLSEDISATDFFEQPFDAIIGLTEKEWLEARKNRRILFNAMKYLGFTNYPSEWWHYDLGDGMWAQATGSETIYHSMEAVVQEILKNICLNNLIS